MPVSGLVITLADGADLDPLRALQPLSFGEAVGCRLPAVAETDDVLSEQALYEQIEALPGVLQLEVAFHDFSDVSEVERLPSRRRNKRMR